MSSEAPVITFAPEALQYSRLKNFRLIPRIETYPIVVSLAQTFAGKAVLLLVFALLLQGAHQPGWLIGACLALPTFFPKKRHLAVTLATFFYTVAMIWMWMARPVGTLTQVAVVFGLGATLIWLARAWRYLRTGLRPLTTLFAIFTALILLCCCLPKQNALSTPLWRFVMVFGTYVWFIGYVLLDREAQPLRRFGLELGSLQPFWGSTITPFPSGPACLRQIEGKDAEKLAIIQLKGLKLLVWSVLISLFQTGYQWLFHDHLGIPHYEKALYLSSRHTPLPWFVCWASVILYYFYKLTSISIWGHRIVACCRMAGFDALRNTCRPLSSTTVAEFFNRYYFYYKELLVHFFFFPTFLRLPSRLGRLRIAIAIFASACLGNAYYHFTRELWYIQAHGFWQGVKTFQVFFFYTVVLALGITISQRRSKPDPSRGFIRGKLIPAFLVSVFYCLLGIFATTDRTYPLAEYLRFLGHLFFLN